MKKIIIFILIITSSYIIKAQEMIWEKSLGGAFADIIGDVIITTDNSIVLVGSSLSFNPSTLKDSPQSDFNFLIIKMDQSSNIIWTKVFGTENTDIGKCIQQTSDLGYIVAGTSNGGKSGDKTSSNIGQDDIWLLKLDRYGSIEWQKTIGGHGMDAVNNIISMNDGTYLIAGNSESDITENEELANESNIILKTTHCRGSQDFWIIKLDQNGNRVWERTFGGIYFDELRGVVQTEDRGFILAGISNSPESGDKTSGNEGFNDWWLIKTDDTGKIIWQKTIGSETDEQVYSINKTNSNTFILGGNKSIKQASDESDFFIITIDPIGNVLDESFINEGRTDILSNLIPLRDGNFILSGFSSSFDFNEPDQILQDTKEDFFIIKLNSRVEEIWRKSLETESNDLLAKTIVSNDGGIILAGTKARELGGDVYIVKLLDALNPRSISVLSVTPNPASTYIKVEIPYEFEKGTAFLIDFNGKIIDETDFIDKNQLYFNIEGLPDAPYFINVKTDVREDVIKFIKTKL